MGPTTFGEIVTWLQGVYNREFPEATRKAAWTLLHGYDDKIVQEGAKRMADEVAEFPSPAIWLQHVKAIQSERHHAEQMALTQRRADAVHQLPHATAATGYQEFRKALEGLHVGGHARRYPSMGPREILAVRALEESGTGHDEAVAAVRAARPVKSGA